MTTHAPTHRNGLRTEHQPRPWSCTGPAAIYCPLHGDCSCEQGRPDSPPRTATDCPLHGPHTEHGTTPPRLVR